MNPDQHRLTEAEHQAIFDNEIKGEIFAHAKKTDRPVAVIFGGQPGAGKSTAVEEAAHDLKTRGGAVTIVGDELRAYHPEYARLMQADDKSAAFYTDRDTGRWIEKAIEEGKNQRVNLVIEGTMRDADKVATTMKSLRDAGYEIDARALAVSSRLSEQGILQRYEAQKEDRGIGRMTTEESHQAAFNGLPVTVERIEREKLADRMTIYRRGAEVVYSNELQHGQWAKTPQAREALEFERSREMTLHERREYVKGFETLAKLMARPERNASAQEFAYMENLQKQAKAGLAAEVFRREPIDQAVQQHPELAPAYASLRAIEAKVETDSAMRQHSNFIMARVRHNIAAHIERGEPIPGVEIREERQVSHDQQHNQQTR